MNARLVVALLLFFAALAWSTWTELRVSGLEIRMNLQEASQHWLDEPPAKDSIR